jgi:hypothetical protein
MFLPVNALRAGASLPVAIVAGCLELLRRIPGFTMIGTKPLLKLGISIAIDFIGSCVCVRVRVCARACVCARTCVPCSQLSRMSLLKIQDTCKYYKCDNP